VHVHKHARYIGKTSYEALIGAGAVLTVYQLWQFFWWKRYNKKHNTSLTFAQWKKLDE
jgi:hypothetical protein